jgi:hypothetical protein
MDLDNRCGDTAPADLCRRSASADEPSALGWRRITPRAELLGKQGRHATVRGHGKLCRADACHPTKHLLALRPPAAKRHGGQKADPATSDRRLRLGGWRVPHCTVRTETSFLPNFAHFILKTEYFPRQARDKHRQRFNDNSCFCRAWRQAPGLVPGSSYCGHIVVANGAEQSAQSFTLQVRRETVFLFSPLFILKMTSFCQDRLGTNIGKALKTRLCYRSWADRSLSTRRGGRCASCACSTWTTQLLSRPTAPSRITLMRHRTMSTRSATAATRRRLRPLVCASQPLSRAAATTFQICGVLTRRALARVGSTTPIAAAFLPKAPAQTW